MIINKKSWHYRLVTAGSNKAPVNLCPYVRRLLWVILCWIGVAFFVTLAGLGIGTTLIPHIFPAFTSGVAFLVVSGVVGVLLFSAIVVAVIGIAIGVAFSMKKYEEYKENKEIERAISGVPLKPKSLLVAWIEAKHNKICPSLEFNNDKA